MKCFISSVVASALAIFSLSVYAGEPSSGVLQNTPRTNCWAGDRLFKAALSDGFMVGAEGQSERPDISGAHIYVMYHPKEKLWGVIASAQDENGSWQCSVGKGTK